MIGSKFQIDSNKTSFLLRNRQLFMQNLSAENQSLLKGTFLQLVPVQNFCHL